MIGLTTQFSDGSSAQIRKFPPPSLVNPISKPNPAALAQSQHWGVALRCVAHSRTEVALLRLGDCTISVRAVESFGALHPPPSSTSSIELRRSAAMSSHTRSKRVTEAEWETHKATIRRLYLDEDKPLKDLVDDVRKLGLDVR